jgi:hypothetical protein
MVSRLREIVHKIAEKKEMRIESYQDEKLATIERHYDAGEVDMDGALKEIEKIFTFHFSSADYREIKHQLELKA